MTVTLDCGGFLVSVFVEFHAVIHLKTVLVKQPLVLRYALRYHVQYFCFTVEPL